MFLLLGTLISPRSAHAQDNFECFYVSGVSQCIQGRFLQYWRENGGLSIFGYPVSGEVQEQTPDGLFTVQYFERNRFELHPEKARPYDVLLGRLGDTRLQQLERNWASEPAGWQNNECRWFDETHHSICGAFRTYWEAYGLNDPNLNRTARSLQLFGLPLTEPRLETNSSGDTVLTQWFERARFEWHREQGILLGLLGNEIQNNPSIPGDLLDFATTDVEQFWDRTFAQRGWEYFSPDAVVAFDRPVDTQCGIADPADRGAHYCPGDYTIYLELNQLDAEFRQFGDMAIVTIIAHEWGHHIQEIRNDISPYSIDNESGADCFAGAYAADANRRGILDQGDLEEALASLTNAGDPPGTPSSDPNAHGSPRSRRINFLSGFDAGVEICPLR